MNSKKIQGRDEIYSQKKNETLTAQSFLAVLKKKLDKDTAFKIAKEAFEMYMTSLYKSILSLTKEGSQERFDKFRQFYEEYAEKTPYLIIIESTSTILKVKYERCPFFEVLEEMDLGEMAYAFCLSDPGFTEKVLPGVKFSRTYEIAKGGPYCDNTWEYEKPNI